MNRLKGLAAASIIAILLIGMPTLLVALGIPRLATTANPLEVLLRPDDGTLVLAILWALAWIAWLIIAIAIAAELIAAFRWVRAPRLTGLHVPQALAHQLVGTAALLFVATSSITPAHATPPTPALAANQEAAAPAPAVAVEETSVQAPATISYVVQPGDSLWRIAERHLGAGDQYGQIVALNTQRLGGKPDFLQPGWTLQLPAPNPTPTRAAQASPALVIVQPGDTLTQLAKTHLGDPDRWPEIYQASRHLPQPSGARLEDPDHIEPGWTLHLPASLNPAEAPPADITGPTIQEAVPDEAGREQLSPDAHTEVAPDVDALEVPTPSRARLTPLPESDTPAEPSSPAGDEVASDLDEPPVASWVVAGLAGGGVLCGSLALGLARRRALQARFRRPGRAIPATPKPLARLEKTITTRPQVAFDVADLDGLLWWTAHEHHTHGLPVPTILALSINPQQVTIHLANGQELLPPWQATTDENTRWSLDRDRLPPFGPDRPGAPAWPQLTSIGVTETGTTWLLNLEAAGILHLIGDPTQTADYTRHLVAELALNPWARDVRIDCLNTCHELVSLDPTKIHHHNHSGTLIDTAHVEAADTASDLTLAPAGTLAHARASNAGYDLWPSHALIIGTHLDPDAGADLDQLATTILSQPSRPTGISLVLTTTPTTIDGSIELYLTSQGRAQLPALGLDLIAVGLTSDEAQGCADLIVAADTLHDTPNPPDDHPPTPVPIDVTGNLTDPRLLDRTQSDDQTVCLLPEPDDTYLAVAATTSDDLAVLAPHIPATLAEAIHDSDPTLDDDLAEWHAGDGPRPRLSVLGPIHARVGHGGNPLAATKRKPFYTELLAYLWTRPHGASTDQVTEALGISEDRARRDLSKLREWLGINPTTGQPHLPPAMKSKTGQRLGIGVYEVEDLLVDADLFKRLRTRAQARGEDGLTDLHAALSLVQGAPFTEVRPQGGAWLVDTATPQYLRAAIVDVAHILHIAALTAGDTEQALWAAHIANQAAPEEITPQLDLTAAAHATGRHLEADRLLTNALLDDQTEAPLDPSPRTHQVLAQRNWTNA